MNSDSERHVARQVYPPRPTSAPHKVRGTKSIENIPSSTGTLSGNDVKSDAGARDTTIIAGTPKRVARMPRPVSSKGRSRQHFSSSETHCVNDSQLRDANYNYKISSDSVSDASSIKSYRSSRSATSNRSVRSASSSRSSKSIGRRMPRGEGRRRRPVTRGATGRPDDRSRRRRSRYALGSSEVAPAYNVSTTVESAPKETEPEASGPPKPNYWAKIRQSVKVVKQVKKFKRNKSETTFHQPLELTYQDETKSLSYQYELSRLFEIHHNLMTMAQNGINTNIDPLALRWRDRRNKDRKKDRAKDFDIPKTLKMKASYEQIRIWKNRLSSYIHRIQSVKSHIDTTSEPASSYLSLVQAERRKERLKKTSNRRYKIYHKKKLAQLENSWNNRTTLS